MVYSDLREDIRYQFPASRFHTILAEKIVHVRKKAGERSPAWSIYAQPIETAMIIAMVPMPTQIPKRGSIQRNHLEYGIPATPIQAMRTPEVGIIVLDIPSPHW
jgi:hypothetical protein